MDQAHQNYDWSSKDQAQAYQRQNWALSPLPPQSQAQLRLKPEAQAQAQLKPETQAHAQLKPS